MKLKVTLRGTQRTENIQITADATATVGDVAMSLAHSDRLQGQFPPDRELTLRVLEDSTQPTVLPPERSLLESGIFSGSTIEIGFAEEAVAARGRAATAAVLRVVGGPDAGQEFMLPLGSATLGRAPECDIRLSDPMVSKRHCRIVVGARVEIIDTGSANGVVVGGVRMPRVALAHGESVDLGDTRISVSVVPAVLASASSTDVGYIRPPRVIGRPERREIELPDPPGLPRSGRFPWLALLAPLLMGGLLFFLRSGSGLLPLAVVALSPLLMLANYVDQRVQRRRTHREEVDTFVATLETREQELRMAHERERAQRLDLYPSTAACTDAALHRNGVLWTRRPEHPEFLQIRLGLGDIVPLVQVSEPRPGGLPEHYERAVALADAYATLRDAPVVADLHSVGGIGLCGAPPALPDAARALVAQIVALHSPAEVVLTCLTGPEQRATWEWLEWLPHTASPHSPLSGAHLAADPGTGRLLLNQLEELIAVRANGSGPMARGPLAKEDGGAVPTVPAVVVVIDGTSVDIARLTRIAETGPDVGVHVVWIAATASHLPAACRTFMDVGLAGGAVGMVRQGRTVQDVAVEALGSEEAMRFARRLAPVYDAGSPVEDQSDLPQTVSMVGLLGHEASDDAGVVLSRWRENQSLVVRDGTPWIARDRESGLVAVVGHAGTEQFTLDLRSQGPHALVGGTTGAGKSEFLQAWVLGLAHAYSPDRVTFLFVDYKGGAAFASCLDLPHTVGLVTDLSPYLVRRALRSLRAELHFRERLLNSKGKKDLIELEKSGDPDCPPSLIIVVDEFAALVGEVPEFVDGVVDVAQRGRSLGLHLVLATQRPAGVIKDNLRANTNLRIALRMADESDSADVLGDKMAAHFPASIPGRGAAKTGPGRITRFQSAFPGARTVIEAESAPIEVVDLDFGPGKPWRMPERPKVDTGIAKDIDRVVGTIAEASRRGAVPPPRKPWLESLANTYNLARLSPRRDTRIPLGVLDDPDHQRQSIEYFKPDEDGNILFVGTGGSGKSTSLRTLAIASAITPAGGTVHVYGLDFAGGALGSLEVMPNVGSIVPGEDEERVHRLLSQLSAQVEMRSARYAAAGAYTLPDYRARPGGEDEPRILLLIDGFSTFRSEYDGTVARQATFTRFQRLLVDGPRFGVHVAMTADRPSAVPNSVLSAFQRRIVLRQADEDGYAALGVPRDVLTPLSPPGRAMQVDNPQELQLAVLLSDEHTRTNNTSTAAQLVAMERLAIELAPHHQRPAAIESLASQVDASTVPATVDGKPVLGIADETLAPMPFDPTGIVMVAGPSQSGRTNALHWLALSVRRWFPDVALAHLSARRTPLSTLDLWTISAQSEADVTAVLTDLDAVASQQAPAGKPLVAVFVEFLPEFIGTPSEQQLLKLISTLRKNGHLVVAEGESASWGAPWPLAMEVRNQRTGLLLQPDQADGDTLLRTSLPRVKRADFPPGRGYWVRAGRAHRVQVPLVDSWGDRPIDSPEPTLHADAVAEPIPVETR